MRWSIIRLIWLRELRDQLRDRRTVFMVAVLPVVLYPVLGVGVLQFALGFGTKPSEVGVVGAEYLPPAAEPDPDYPPLLHADGNAARFVPAYFEPPTDAALLKVRLLPPPGEGEGDWCERVDRTPLERHEVDVILAVPPDFRDRLRQDGKPALCLLAREDDRSRQARGRVQAVLDRWKQQLKEGRLRRQGLPADFDKPFEVREPARDKPGSKDLSQRLFEAFVPIFPFLLVMWSLTGALYPAVDLCAGEKERGTMETLLISPASREEIVYGKFLTIWVFSGATALLNLASMAVTTGVFSGALRVAALRPAALVWCVVLLLPLSAFFSALCLAIGAYARSTKEGQYYLMPLFLVTLPLIFLTLAPGVELNAFWSMVPVTGVALLLQRLMVASSLDEVPWAYFVPVLGPILLYGWLALRWAVWQFQREEVLFREAERLDVRLWLRQLFRDKEPLPSTGQALFCFGLILALRWLTLGFGAGLSPLVQAAINTVAFVIAPTLFMALVLTTRPVEGLGLRLPPGRAVLTALLLVVLLALPFAELTRFLLERFPDVQAAAKVNSPLAETMLSVQRGAVEAVPWWQLLLVLVVLAPVCEELAFRGFILTGLRRRFKPWTAILLSSFLFAVSHLNVFQFLPLFLLGVVLGLLATRSRSVLLGMLVHAVHNGLLVGPVLFPQWAGAVNGTLDAVPGLRGALVAGCALAAAFYLVVSGYRLWAHGTPDWLDAVPPGG